MNKMKKKEQLILEYAKLASLAVIQGQKTIDARMLAIVTELHMTPETIMKYAVEKAVAAIK